MKRYIIAAAILAATALAAEIKVSLGSEQVGKPPVTFEPIVGTWVVARDGADKVIMVDGRILATGTPEQIRGRARTPEGKEPTIEDAFVAIVEDYRMAMEEK